MVRVVVGCNDGGGKAGVDRRQGGGDDFPIIGRTVSFLKGFTEMIDVAGARILARTFGPYLIAGAVGFVPAWWIQSIRLDSAKGDVAVVQRKFDDYKTEQRRLLVEAGETAEKRRAETIKEWSGKYDKLKNDSDIYRRCVAAGKCGVRPVSGSSGLKLSPSLGITPTGTNTIPAAPRITEEDQVLRDCAVTTLMINSLQSDIEKQMR